jgi:hypothetical protein
VEDSEQQQRYRRRQVQGPPQVRIVEDPAGLPRIGVYVRGGARLGADQQGPGVGQHDGVVVDVDDPDPRGGGLCDLVHVRAGRKPGADVEELADAQFRGQERDHAAHQRPVLPHGQGQVREGGGRFLGRHPVGGEIVLTAE